MKTQLENIYKNATQDLEKASTITDIEEIRTKYLSRKGEFNEIKKGLKDLPDEERRIIGSMANEITQKLEQGLKNKYDEFYKKELNEKLQKEQLDVTLTGKYTPLGHIHPITSTTNEIVSIFQNPCG